MLNRIRLNTNNYNVDELFRLAMEQPLYITSIDEHEPETIYYTLKQLTMMPFEQWARLIELENITTNA